MTESDEPLAGVSPEEPTQPLHTSTPKKPIHTSKTGKGRPVHIYAPQVKQEKADQFGELETGQKRVLERITEQQNENEKQKKMLETISEQRTIVDKLQNTTEELETGQKRVLETITEQQTVNEKQKKILETMSEQQIVIDKLQNIIRGSKSTNVGTTYTRWGKPSCPGNGTETIYSGLVAGSHYTHKGAAANYLCLTQQPSWNKYNDKQEAGGLVYGAEYEFYHRSRQHFFGREIIDEDPPCAVCRTERPTVIMIPGSRHCRDGWTMEYHGYLSSGSYGQPAATEFVCLDVDPEVISGGRSNNNGKLFYLTEIRCGSSSICPPYVNGRELSCVVCSK
ncbi:hypothetical protein MAR_000290 [Mya arenaria]|uniref:Short-chain collagen C4-like n=1 Tax=Mya arenaria TaxID=6604 RepID=A0ABY7FA27_MYAAR|nr:hypothetical protein MAR_000290 [Mya arenaria]